MSDLNPQQRAAVEHGDGPLLILAGAGSGKTRVITHRIAHLVGRHRVPPASILALTFTNKAADVMAGRVAALLGPGLRPPLVGTFHSFCVRVLRQDYPAVGGARDFVIYAEDEQLRLVKALCRQLGVDDKQVAPRHLLGRISFAKNRGQSPADLRANAVDPRSERVAAIYELYQRGLRQAGALDFDDLLLETGRLLRESEEVAARYNQRFHYLLVDEYQDTNRPQYLLLRQLTRDRRNLCAVGDEDQSIYSWRGADLRNILDFERDYPEAAVIRLEENYRSTGNILSAASALVANNLARKGKTLWTRAGAGARIGHCLAVDAEGEANWVAETVRRLLRERPQRQIAVLYRVNAQSRLFEESLRRQEIAYRVVGGFSFYQRAEVRDLLAYLRVAVNPADSISLLRVINVPARGLGGTTVSALERAALERDRSVCAAIEAALQVPGGLAPRAQAALAAFYKLVADLHAAAAALSVADLLRLVLDRSGYARALEQEGTPEAASRLENIAELVNAAADAAARGEGAAAFLDHAALLGDQDDFDPAAPVHLMTLHAAKGLEFAVVFLAGLEEGLFPHSRAVDAPGDMEEERRLCYVGMTRARERLYLSHAARRRRYGRTVSEYAEPSRFLIEVPRELLEECGAASAPARSGQLRYVRDGWEQDGHYRVDARTDARVHDRVDDHDRAHDRADADSIASIQRFFQPRRDAAAPPPPAAAVRHPPPRKMGLVSAGGLRAGARVRHARYGSGTVLQIEGEGELTKLTVSFPGYGLRKMLEKMADLKPL